MTKKASIVGIVMSLIVMMFFPGLASAQQVKPEGIRYVALGDSLAAGVTPYRQIGKSYTDYAAADMKTAGYLNTWTKSYAVPGAKSADVLAQVAAAQGELAKADLVTIQAGANDLLKYLLTQLAIAQQTGTAPQIDPNQVQQIIYEVGTNVALTLKGIHTINPEAKVFVLGYYNALPHLPAETQQALVPALYGMNSAIQQAAGLMGATYVDISTVFEANPTAYLPNPTDVHPTEAGYRLIADKLLTAVEPMLPALKANHILNQAAAIPLTSQPSIANALYLTLSAKQYVKNLPAGAEQTYLVQKMNTMLEQLNIARKALKGNKKVS